MLRESSARRKDGSETSRPIPTKRFPNSFLHSPYTIDMLKGVFNSQLLHYTLCKVVGYWLLCHGRGRCCGGPWAS